jgi:GTPase SAR1 family protein
LPTIGFRYECLRFSKSIELSLFDIQYQREKYRRILRQSKADAIIYVVDSSSKERLQEVREDIEHLLEIIVKMNRIRNIPLVIMAHK